MKTITALLLLTLATPVFAQDVQHRQFVYRVLVPAGKCVPVTGTPTWDGPALPLRNVWGPQAQITVTSASVKTLGKPVGLSLLLNGEVLATDSDGVAHFPDGGLAVSGQFLAGSVYNASPSVAWAYVVVTATVRLVDDGGTR